MVQIVKRTTRLGGLSGELGAKCVFDASFAYSLRNIHLLLEHLPANIIRYYYSSEKPQGFKMGSSVIGSEIRGLL